MSMLEARGKSISPVEAKVHMRKLAHKHLHNS